MVWRGVVELSRSYLPEATKDDTLTFVSLGPMNMGENVLRVSRCTQPKISNHEIPGFGGTNGTDPCESNVVNESHA